MNDVAPWIVAFVLVGWFLRRAHVAKSSGEELGSFTKIVLALLTVGGALGALQLFFRAVDASGIHSLFLFVAGFFVALVAGSAAYAWLGPGFSRASFEEGDELTREHIGDIFRD